MLPVCQYHMPIRSTELSASEKRQSRCIAIRYSILAAKSSLRYHVFRSRKVNVIKQFYESRPRNQLFQRCACAAYLLYVECIPTCFFRTTELSIISCTPDSRCTTRHDIFESRHPCTPFLLAMVCVQISALLKKAV